MLWGASKLLSGSLLITFRNQLIWLVQCWIPLISDHLLDTFTICYHRYIVYNIEVQSESVLAAAARRMEIGKLLTTMSRCVHFSQLINLINFTLFINIFNSTFVTLCFNAKYTFLQFCIFKSKLISSIWFYMHLHDFYSFYMHTSCNSALL